MVCHGQKKEIKAGAKVPHRLLVRDAVFLNEVHVPLRTLLLLHIVAEVLGPV